MGVAVTGAGYHAGPGAETELHAGHAHAAGCPRHQEPFAHGQAGLGEQGVIGGEEHFGEAARLSHRHGGGDGQSEAFVDQGQFGLRRPT